MKKIYGTGVSSGISMGVLKLLNKNENRAVKRSVSDTKGELIRFKTAQNQAVKELNEIYRQSQMRLGEKASMIFQVQAMMLKDEDFENAVFEKIKNEHVNAEYAVEMTGKEFADRFRSMDDDYMQARSLDVADISIRLVQGLNQSFKKEVWQCKTPAVLAAEELTPSETMQLDKTKLLAIITRSGSNTSHAAILARTMGIPSVASLGEDYDCLKDGAFVIVDGKSGEVVLDPDEPAKQFYDQKARQNFIDRQQLRALVEKEMGTKDRKKIQINANIAAPEDADAALENGADGIGLFRSEFLYMGRDRLPSEKEQAQAYAVVLKKMGGRPVIIRTFDIGADKQIPYLNLPKEANPALGYRAIRICLDRKELFYTQLSALLRASVFGNLKIMFPMITSPQEVRDAKAVLEQVKADLISKAVPFSENVKVGIMIETPAAVMLSEALAKECDFFSVGTNDLTQYTLAADRINDKVSYLYDQSHPAVLKMIQLAAESAHKSGIPIGICGELAVDDNLTDFFLSIGIDELSVAPSSILEIKKGFLNSDCNKTLPTFSE